MSYSKEEYQILLQTFKIVLACAKAGAIISPVSGICFNGMGIARGIANEVYKPLVCVYTAVELLSDGWPHHSGCSLCPVARPEGLTSMAGELWKGEQLALRINLLEYMIAKIEAQLRDMED